MRSIYPATGRGGSADRRSAVSPTASRPGVITFNDFGWQAASCRRGRLRFSRPAVCVTVTTRSRLVVLSSCARNQTNPDLTLAGKCYLYYARIRTEAINPGHAVFLTTTKLEKLWPLNYLRFRIRITRSNR